MCLLISGCSNDSDVVQIRAISSVPTETPYTRDFAAWIKAVNARAAGRFKIILVGGPEVIPTYEQADAVRTGVVHMVFGPGTYYLGHVPEIEALFASNLPPWETRANGGVALLDRLHRAKLGVTYLARTHFIAFHIFTRHAPGLSDAGVPDLSQRRIRGGPVWRDFITSLGAVFVNVPAPDIYTALERGMIDGISWPVVGLQDFSWDKHIKYRVDPGVYSSDMGIIFNARRWDALPADVRELLSEAVIDYERVSYERFLALSTEAAVQLQQDGMQTVSLADTGESAYRQLAFDVIWDRLKTRAPENYAELKRIFYRD